MTQVIVSVDSPIDVGISEQSIGSFANDMTIIELELSTDTIVCEVQDPYIIEVGVYLGLPGPQGPTGDSGVESATFTWEDGILLTKTTDTGSSTYNYDAGILVSVTGTGTHQSKTFTYDVEGNLINMEIN